jgi:hypothetical protein
VTEWSHCRFPIVPACFLSYSRLHGRSFDFSLHRADIFRGDSIRCPVLSSNMFFGPLHTECTVLTTVLIADSVCDNRLTLRSAPLRQKHCCSLHDSPIWRPSSGSDTGIQLAMENGVFFALPVTDGEICQFLERKGILML